MLLNGADVRAFIYDTNIERRNLGPGQRAMLTAMIYPEPEKGGRGKKGKALVTGGLSHQRLSLARAVLKHSTTLAQQVVSGTMTLDKAIEQVRLAEQQRDTTQGKLARLRAEAPDLADLVKDDRMKLTEAIPAATSIWRNRCRVYTLCYCPTVAG